MVDIEELLRPVLDDAPDPAPFAMVAARAGARRRRRRARGIVGAVLVAALVAGGVAVVATRSSRTRVQLVAPTQHADVNVRVGKPTVFRQAGTDMISAFGSIWVAQPDRVVRIDPATGRVAASFVVPGESDFRNLTVGAGAVWVDDTGKETVTRLDPVRNRIAATIPLPDRVFVTDGVAFVDGLLWIARPVPNDETRGDVIAIDPATNRIVHRAPVPRTFDIVAGTHALWYVSDTKVVPAPDLVRFDTRSRRATVVRRSVQAILAVADGRVWLSTAAGVIETDERTGAQIGSVIPLTNTVNTAAVVSSGVVWIAAQPDSSSPGQATPYDATTHRALAAPINVNFPIVAMTTLDNALWVDAYVLTRVPFAR